ncbi:hypothetical protein BDQ12DRAFT_691810 [Crucibulum laeve]|uniref:Extracellular membrane protein CFEM domain-containing protein n=1 Tax=Crucibulum laeve TaxID=68775 RepID=A0A5C3LIL1_9AGAR|nr:hypothetical protein BDQ12DRAFT_691810 [Crucibulum laeve]
MSMTLVSFIVYSVLIFTPMGLAMHLPDTGRQVATLQCRTNISIPSSSETCFSICQPLRDAQQQCDDTIPCMCQNAPPASMTTCLGCIMTDAGDFFHTFPDYLTDIADDVEAYANTCQRISTTRSSGDESASSIHSLCASQFSSYFQPNASVSLWQEIHLHKILPLLSFASAVILVLIISLRC